MSGLHYRPRYNGVSRVLGLSKITSAELHFFAFKFFHSLFTYRHLIKPQRVRRRIAELIISAFLNDHDQFQALALERIFYESRLIKHINREKHYQGFNQSFFIATIDGRSGNLSVSVRICINRCPVRRALCCEPERPTPDSRLDPRPSGTGDSLV